MRLKSDHKPEVKCQGIGCNLLETVSVGRAILPTDPGRDGGKILWPALRGWSTWEDCEEPASG